MLRHEPSGAKDTTTGSPVLAPIKEIVYPTLSKLHLKPSLVVIVAF